jgi:hypothetical protein
MGTIDYIWKELEELRETAPYVPTTVKLAKGEVTLLDCFDESGNLPRLSDKTRDVNTMAENYLRKLGIDPSYCCDESGNLPRLPNGGIDLDAIMDKYHNKLQSQLDDKGYVPPED